MDVYFGGLLELDENEDIVQTMSQIDINQAVKIIETSISYAVKSGTFNLTESYILYNCLSKLKANNDKV